LKRRNWTKLDQVGEISGSDKANDVEMTVKERRFSAQGQYAESVFRSSLGDLGASIRALERALEIDPEYAPAILSMGTVEYQRQRKDRGKELLLSLVSLPSSAADGGESDLAEIIDEAGDFLIQSGHYADGLELYRAAVMRFPRHAVLHQGVGCCAGHEGQHNEAIAASETAVELDPENQKFVNDLGWSLFEASLLGEARQVLSRAVAMDPSDELARENLRLCTAAITRGASGE
jgi:tetratricopeptide (TPR) repeat protein